MLTLPIENTLINLENLQLHKFKDFCFFLEIVLIFLTNIKNVPKFWQKCSKYYNKIIKHAIFATQRKPVTVPSAPEKTPFAKIRRSIASQSEKRNIARLNNYLLTEKITAINESLPVRKLKNNFSKKIFFKFLSSFCSW